MWLSHDIFKKPRKNDYGNTCIHLNVPMCRTPPPPPEIPCTDQCCLNVGPPSTTMAQHSHSFGSGGLHRVYWTNGVIYYYYLIILLHHTSSYLPMCVTTSHQLSAVITSIFRSFNSEFINFPADAMAVIV